MRHKWKYLDCSSREMYCEKCGAEMNIVNRENKRAYGGYSLDEYVTMPGCQPVMVPPMPPCPGSHAFSICSKRGNSGSES